MSRLPSFETACGELRALLSSQGRPSALTWAFREDLFSVRPGAYVVRWPLPEPNSELARRYFDQWTSSGAVELRAICELEGSAIVSPWSPFELPDGVQGWESGFRATIQQPWGAAFAVTSGAAWWIHRQRPAYKRFQTFGIGIPVRPQASGQYLPPTGQHR